MDLSDPRKKLPNIGIAPSRPLPSLRVTPVGSPVPQQVTVNGGRPLAPAAATAPGPLPVQNQPSGLRIRVGNTLADYSGPAQSWNTAAQPKGSALDLVGGVGLGGVSAGAKLVTGTLALGGRFNPIHKTFEGQSPNGLSQFVKNLNNIDNVNDPNSLISRVGDNSKNLRLGQRAGSDIVNAAGIASAVKAIPATLKEIPAAARGIKNIPSAISDMRNISKLAKAKTPQAVKAVAPNVSDEAATVIANTDNKDLIRLVHGVEVDKTLGDTAQLTDNVAQALQEGGVNKVKQRDVSTGAAYDRSTNAILLKDGSQATPAELFHEMGHSIYSTRLSDQERQAFEGIHGAAYQQAQSEGRTGYDLSSEDFADFMSKHLTGHDNLVPSEVLPIIKKYAPKFEQQLEQAGLPAKQIISGLKEQTSPGRNAHAEASTIEPTQLNDFLNQAVENQKGSLKDSSKFRRAEEKINPAAPLSRIDKAFAKSQGLSHNKLPAVQSLENAYDIARSSASQADRIAREGGLNHVLQNYPKKGAQQDFMNYLNARFASEVHDKRGLSLIRDGQGNPVPKETLDKFVADYEAHNPNAAKDASTVKGFFDARLQHASEAGIISPEDAKFISQYYKNYVPLERVLPEDIQRAGINARPVGTLGRQTILQQLEGSDLPLSNDIGTLYKRNNSIQSQINRNKLFNMFNERVNQGVVPGARVIQSAADVTAREAAKARFSELQDVAKSLTSEIGRQRTNMRIAGKDRNRATNAAVVRAKELLRNTVTEPDAKAAIDGMSKKDLLDVLKVAAEPDIRKTPNVQRIYDNFVKKGTAYQHIADTVESMKSDLGAAQSAKQTAREEAWSLGHDPTTGQQVIHGMEDGKPVILGVTPEVARVLGGIGEQELTGVMKGFRDATRPFRAAWTGLAAPIFNMVSAAIYDPAAGFLISKNGTRALLSPSAWGAFFKSFNSNSQFRSALQKAGAQVQYGSLVSQDMERQLGRVIAQNGALSRAKFYANPKNIRQTINALDEFSGKLTAANRDRFAKAAYDAGVRSGMTHDDAMQEAVYAYNNVLPNFRRTSHALQEIDAVLPYTSASVAGTRALGIALRRRPIQTVSKLAAIGVAPPVMLTLHNLSQPQGQNFYQDMQQSGKEQQLNTNLFVVTPWASKDEQTGQWNGVFKVPVPPELRALNKEAWHQTYNAAVNHKADSPLNYATAAFDTLTGQVSPVTLNNEGKISAQYGSSNPVVQTGQILTGTNPQTGQPIVPDSLQGLPQDQQVLPSTSGLAKVIGKVPGVSPIKAQALLNQFGATGRIVQGNNPLQELQDRFTKIYGDSAGQRFFKNVDATVKAQGLNPNEQKAFYGTILPSKTDAAGNILNDKTYYDTASKATTWLRYPKTFEVSKQLDAINRKSGEPGDPLYDLDPQQQKIVLNLMANYSPGNFEEKAIQKLNPWVKDFYDKRGAYFDQIAAQNAQNLKNLQARPDAKSNPQISNKIQKLQQSAASAGIDPMGLKIPKETSNVKALFNQVDGLTDGAERAKFYASHPELTDYMAQADAYQRAKRSYLALPQFDERPVASPELQKSLDAYTALPKGTGARSAWIKANPGIWTQMTDYFDKSSSYNTAREGALAVYQGIDFPQSTQDKITGGSGSGSGGFNFSNFNRKPAGRTGESVTDLLSNNLKGSTAQKNIAVPSSKYGSIGFPKKPSAKVKKVSIPSLSLPNKAPTFKIGNSKQP
jgi:hypothetical protein